MNNEEPQQRPPISPKPNGAKRRPINRRQIRIGKRSIITEGIPAAVFQDLFHYFMTVSWPQLFATFAMFFLVFDTLFGCLYFWNPGCIANLNPPGFAGAFFFSVETLATVGYGDMHPQTLYGHSIAMIEIFVGLMSLALITGIMFARFSRPRARFMFTKNLVVRTLDGRTTLMIRAANLRQNVVQDASARLYMLRDETTHEGFRIRRVIDLPLVRSHHPMFVLGWTLMHSIDDNSPLQQETAESLRLTATAFVLSLSGTDETTGQTLTSRAEYSHEDLLWNANFHDMIEESADGTLRIDYTRFNEIHQD